MLVEGIAELLLVPRLAYLMGIDLKKEGVSVISVDGLAFDPFVALFEPGGLPQRCVVLTDTDLSVDDDGEEVVSATAAALRARASGNVHVATSERTFEWELAKANHGSPQILIDALREVKPRVAGRLADNATQDSTAFADMFLAAVRDSKGRFAQELADLIASGRSDLVVPAGAAAAISAAIAPLGAGPTPEDRATEPLVEQ